MDSLHSRNVSDRINDYVIDTREISGRSRVNFAKREKLYFRVRIMIVAAWTAFAVASWVWGKVEDVIDTGHPSGYRDTSTDPDRALPSTRHHPRLSTVALSIRINQNGFFRFKCLLDDSIAVLWAAVFTFNPYLLISILISINKAASVIFIDINK